MQSYRIIVSTAAISDLDGIVDYIVRHNLPDAGNRYRFRVVEKLKSLEYSADSLPFSRMNMARRIHPNAKCMSIMNRKWTVVFHIDVPFVVIDRILPSSLMTY